MWFSGYRKDKLGIRNYSDEAFRHIKKQAPKLYGVRFENKSYLDLDIPEQSIIYCDPPYNGTAKYKAVDDFDNVKFWQWCRDKVEEGHQVFVSEYNAPDDFVCVWQQELKVSVARSGKQKTATEKLFIHESQLKQAAK